MNGVNLPQPVVDRVVARRGTPHPFDILDPARTALVVVDLQNESRAANRRPLSRPIPASLATTDRSGLRPAGARH